MVLGVPYRVPSIRSSVLKRYIWTPGKLASLERQLSGVRIEVVVHRSTCVMQMCGKRYIWTPGPRAARNKNCSNKIDSNMCILLDIYRCPMRCQCVTIKSIITHYTIWQYTIHYITLLYIFCIL